MEGPLTLAERHKGIVKVISTLREEILFFSDLQKSMEEQNEVLKRGFFFFTRVDILASN